jgi:hypothetical protein
MGVWDSVRAELEEQRCLIEQQQVTIQRQQRKIELQLRLTEHIQAELDRIKLTLQRASPGPPTEASSSDGNGNGHPRATGRHRAAVSHSVGQ